MSLTPTLRRICWGSITGMLLLLCACGNAGRSAYTDDGSAPRDIQRAHALYRQATAQLERGDEAALSRAEHLLRETLAADLYHGPAHNNLGVLLLLQGLLYEAAQEFEWARKLLPGHPDPRINLAIALERGGKYAQALEACTAALDVQPGYLQARRTAAYIQVRHRLVNDQTIDHLDAIIAHGGDDRWVSWATQARLRLAER